MTTRRLMRSLAGSAIVALALLAGPRVGSAREACVRATVTLGYWRVVNQTVCSPALPNDFTQPFTAYQCGGAPPMSLTACVTVSTYTP